MTTSHRWVIIIKEMIQLEYVTVIKIALKLAGKWQTEEEAWTCHTFTRCLFYYLNYAFCFGLNDSIVYVYVFHYWKRFSPKKSFFHAHRYDYDSILFYSILPVVRDFALCKIFEIWSFIQKHVQILSAFRSTRLNQFKLKCNFTFVACSIEFSHHFYKCFLHYQLRNKFVLHFNVVALTRP